MKTDNLQSVRKIVMTGLLAAMSFVLFLFPKFSLLPGFAWLEIDFSDVPALLAAVTLSPVSGLLVVFIKNLIHLAVSHTGMIGELSNFLIGGVFVLAAGLLHRTVFRGEGFRKVVFSVAVGAVFQVIAGVLVNYFIMVPLYAAFVNFEELGGAGYYIVAGVVPFNVVKDVLVGVVFLALYRLIRKPIRTIIHK